MNVLTFKRGIHPPDQKSNTNNKEIVIKMPKKNSIQIFPLIQHLGGPAEAIVSVGQRVLVGEKIAQAKTFVCSPIHSSISGIVKEIKKTLTPTGITCDAIYIENDGIDQEHDEINKPYDYKKMSRDEIIEVIKEAGIVGMGGAGFPTHIKLDPPKEKKIHTIIINAAECEPYLTTDHRVLIEESEKVIRGIEIILSLFENARAIIGIEINKLDAICKLEKILENNNRISVARLKPKYPQGSEKQLIYACIKKEVPSGGLPADVGVIVNNIDTVVAIDRAITRGRPLMRRIITVAGKTVINPGNYKVRIGMTYKDLIDEIGGLNQEPYKIISGGPMMGVAIFDLNIPVIKTSSSLLCFTQEEAQLPKQKNCIRCGKCIDICPMNLMPFLLNQNVIFNENNKFLKNNGMDCIECGACSYICPAKRHLVQSIRAAKKEILLKRKK